MTIIPQLERDLSTAADRRLAAPDGTTAGLRHRGRRLSSGAAIAISAAVVVVVVAIALSLRHGSSSRPPAGPETVQSTRRELIRELAVLSTPQTSAARDPRHDLALGMDPALYQAVARARSRLHNSSVTPRTRAELRGLVSRIESSLAQDGYARPDSSLVRILHAPYNEEIGIDPVTRRATDSSPRRVEELGLSLSVPGSLGQGLSPQPVSALLAHGLSLFTYAHYANIGFMVVPNGVAKVTLGPIHLALGNLVSPTAAPIPTTTVSVRDNIAAFRLPVPSVSPWPSLPSRRSGMSSSGAYVRETWLGPSNHLIKHATVLIAFNFVLRP